VARWWRCAGRYISLRLCQMFACVEINQ
jgi:hypothetical protein